MAMTNSIRIVLLSLLLVKTYLLSFNTLAESRRIEVYTAGQNLWQTKSGETLSGIAQELLPNNPRMQQRLMLDILALNPVAFHDNNPDQMRANIRLLLPGEFTRPDSKVNRSKVEVETFSWGNIKRHRQ